MSNSSALILLLEDASKLIADEPRTGTGSGGDRPPVDPTSTLVEAGWFMLQQLRIALGFTVTGVDADRLVPEVLARAASYGTASPGSVGAAASLVDTVRTDDPLALARAIMAARGAFGDDEMMAGVTALIAALTTQIADSLALDPCLVHAELSEQATAMAPCPATRGRVPARSGRAQHPVCVRQWIASSVWAPIVGALRA